MRSITKVAIVAASALFLQIGAASADPTSQTAQTGSNDAPKTADNACPKGQVEGPDGVCVQAKKGRMGFDLAAPGDDSGSSQSNSSNSRSVSKPHH